MILVNLLKILRPDLDDLAPFAPFRLGVILPTCHGKLVLALTVRGPAARALYGLTGVNHSLQ